MWTLEYIWLGVLSILVLFLIWRVWRIARWLGYNTPLPPPPAGVNADPNRTLYEWVKLMSPVGPGSPTDPPPQPPGPIQ
jgi:hypothetical protein